MARALRTRSAPGPAALLMGWALLGASSTAAAQEPTTLTLREAIALAERSNPDYLAARNDGQLADWNVREAYGAFLPTASANTGLQYTAPGASRFGIFTAEDIGVGGSTGYYLSDYSLNVGYGISGADLFRVGQEKASRRAVVAETDAARFRLHAAVTQQYLAVLRAQDGVTLAERQVASASENLKLARARVQVGDAIPLEAMQAEVEHGRAEVELLRATSFLETERLRLQEQLGVTFEQRVELTSTFPIFDPPWREEDLLRMAAEANPTLRALTARERAAGAAVAMARSAYLPRLDLNMGWSGFTRQASDAGFLLEQARSGAESQRQNCQALNLIAVRLDPPLPTTDCTRFALTPQQERAILEKNEVFPFDFQSQPFSARVTVSLPLFQGFSRQRQVEAARVQTDDVRHRRRAEGLRVRTEVASAHDQLETAARVVRIEERSRELAEEQLRLARERYRVGATNFIELIEAEALRQQADRSYLVAVYDFHQALAALEAVVGQPLPR